MTPFVDLLKAWMSEHRLDGTEAASLLDVSAPTVSRWLKGEPPSIKRVDDLARIMGVSGTEIAMSIVGSGGASAPIDRVERLLQALVLRMDAQDERITRLESPDPPPKPRGK